MPDRKFLNWPMMSNNAQRARIYLENSCIMRAAQAGHACSYHREHVLEVRWRT